MHQICSNSILKTLENSVTLVQNQQKKKHYNNLLKVNNNNTMCEIIGWNLFWSLHLVPWLSTLGINFFAGAVLFICWNKGFFLHRDKIWYPAHSLKNLVGLCTMHQTKMTLITLKLLSKLQINFQKLYYEKSPWSEITMIGEDYKILKFCMLYIDGKYIFQCESRNLARAT